MKVFSLLVGLVSAGLVLRKPQESAEPVAMVDMGNADASAACDECNGSHTKIAQPESTCTAVNTDGGWKFHLMSPASPGSTHAQKENEACVCVMNDQANHGKTSCTPMVSA